MKPVSAFFFTALLLPPPLFAQSKSSVVGWWSSTSATQTIDGKTVGELFGGHPAGRLILSPEGEFAYIIARSDLPNFQTNNRANGTDEENAAIVKGSFAFFGTYTVEGDKMNLHAVASTFPNFTGKDLPSFVHTDGNQLIWETSPGASSGGTAKITFERVK